MWAVFNLGRLFASSMPEYSILTQNEMIVESYWRKNVRRSMQFRERLEPTSTFCLHCFTDRFTLCLRTLFLCLRFIIKRQQKVSVFFKQKKMAVEPENQEDRLDEDSEAEGVSSTSSQPLELQEPTASNSTITVRKFRLAWKNVYPWLQYDEEKGMPCSICVRHRENNTFTKGTNNFRSSTLERHVAHHRQTTLWA